MVSGADSWHHLTTLYSDLVDLRPIANAGDTVQRYVKKGMTYSNFIGMSCLRGVRKKFNAKMKVWWWKCWSYWWYCCCLIHTSPQSRHHFFQQQQPKLPKLIVGDGCGGNCWNHGNNSGAFADIFFSFVINISLCSYCFLGPTHIKLYCSGTHYKICIPSTTTAEELHSSVMWWWYFLYDTIKIWTNVSLLLFEMTISTHNSVYQKHIILFFLNDYLQPLTAFIKNISSLH